MNLRFRLVLCALTFLWCSAFAQETDSAGFKKKINLDDVSIKGEVNKGGSLLNKRSKMSLDERIKIPKDFNNAILENLDPKLEGISNLD